MEFLKVLWGFLNERKKFWLLPIIIILLIKSNLFQTPMSFKNNKISY